MFRFMNLREQLLEERRKNESLRSQVKDIEDATVELAEIVATNEEAINNG